MTSGKKRQSAFGETLTYETKDENGNPWSRAKDQVWRDTVATVLMQAEVILTMRIAVMIDVPAWLLVTLKKTWING